MNILWISACVPYDSVPHAGGKNHNFYLKSFFAKNKNIKLISFFSDEELDKIDLDEYGISNYLICRPLFRKTILKRIQYYIQRRLYELNFFSDGLYYSNSTSLQDVEKMVKRINQEEKYSPGIVILQWTEMGVAIPKLKKIFPKAKFVIVEEDVHFLALYRRWKNSSGFVDYVFGYIDYIRCKRIEKKCLELADLVVVNNKKDSLLLEKNNVACSKTVIAPFFINMQHVNRKYGSKDILFYGAMCRSENYLSAIWFIEKVFPKLEPLGFRFIVVGNKPHESLIKYDNGKTICITGFVDDVSLYFENSLCLVAPLVAGAGIKIKILEAMSSGLPVLTNEVGIEGIFAKNETEYFFCETPEDYEKRIIELSNSVDLIKRMELNAKKFIQENFNYQQSADDLYNKVVSLVRG